MLGHGPGPVHLDIHTDDLAAEIARLQGRGAGRPRCAQPWPWHSTVVTEPSLFSAARLAGDREVRALCQAGRAAVLKP
jgi:Glyoxalase-like domain